MRFIALIFLIISWSAAFAQKHDYVWITGDGNQTFDTTHGGATIDFNFNPPLAYYNPRDLNMFVCNASICDSLGNLIAYTNGCDIAGADDIILENGNNLNPGFAYQVSCLQNDKGYASGTQSAIFLPLPSNDSVYYLFHKQMELILGSNPDAYTKNLLLSIVKKHSVDSKEKYIVEQKNVVLISDTLSYGKLVAVKHANGRDWWIVTPRRKNNVFYVLKLTENGIVDTLTQAIGITPDYTTEGYGQMVFSPDGTKLYRTNPTSPVMVYSFDRSTGVFTSFDTISFDYGFQNPAEIGCAVSPGGRYLYLSCKRYLYQLDLEAADISASQTTVAEWDGYAAPLPTSFSQCQLGPDCKIYIRAGGDTRFYHVIHQPDEPGLSCEVEQRGLPLPTPSGGSMPSFPNYRLGPSDAPGLPCSPTVSAGGGVLPRAPALSVYPNPAEDILHVRYAWKEGTASPVRFALYNALGQWVSSTQLPAGEGSVAIPVGHLKSGIYWYRVEGARKPVSGKIIIKR